MCVHTTIEVERDTIGRFASKAHSEPEASLPREGSLDVAVARNSDVFIRTAADGPDLYSKSMAVGRRGGTSSHIQLVWSKDSERFVVNAWREVHKRPNTYVHLSELTFDDLHTRELVQLIESSDATPDTVDELCAHLRHA